MYIAIHSELKLVTLSPICRYISKGYWVKCQIVQYRCKRPQQGTVLTYLDVAPALVIYIYIYIISKPTNTLPDF